MLGGYQQDHPLVLMADTECQIVGRAADADGRPLISSPTAPEPGALAGRLC